MFRSWSKVFQQGNAVYQLNMLANAAIKTVDERIVELVGLDTRTIRVLRLVGDTPGITFAEIAILGALERSLASRLIQTLVRNNYIERHNDENDARRFGLYITPAGQSKRRHADQLSEMVLGLFFHKLNKDETDAFITTMTKLASWIDSDEFECAAEGMFTSVAMKASPEEPAENESEVAVP